MIRALLDANIFISYLLRKGTPGTIAQLISAAIERQYVPLLPEELLQEMAGAITRKSALSSRIEPVDLQELTSVLLEVGEQIDQIREAVPSASRDPKDTYLLAYALVGQADYLVTGDKDLLVLTSIGAVKIISPADFLAVLREQPLS